MINISPLPLFSDKWHIQMNRMPKLWSSIIEHAIIWTLAFEKRLRDCELGITITNITHEQIIKLDQSDLSQNQNVHENQEYGDEYRDNELDRPAQSIFHDPKQRYVVIRNLGHINRKELNDLGVVYMCTDNVQKHMQGSTDATFVYLIKLFMDIALTLRNQKPSPGYKQKILSRFGLYGV